MVLVDVDRAKEKRKLGMSEEEFEKIVAERQDERFKDLHWHIVFREVEQPDGSKKIYGNLSSGKIVFPDKKEDITNIKLGFPYICLVYEPEVENLKTVAFARIICEEYIPTIFCNVNGIVSAVWRDKQGNIHREPLGLKKEERDMKLSPYHRRLVKALMIMAKDVRAPEVMVVFRENQTDTTSSKKK